MGSREEGQGLHCFQTLGRCVKGVVSRPGCKKCGRKRGEGKGKIQHLNETHKTPLCG